MKYSTWLVVALLCLSSFSSEFDARILIKGKVFSKTNKKPIPYVNVFPQESNYGTFTNLDGEFELLVKEQDYTKRLVASMMGFEDQFIPMDTAITYQIFLKEQILELPEVVLSEMTADQIMDNFRLRVHSNYPEYPLVNRVFLREYERVKGDRNIYLNEVMVDYFREGYFGAGDDLMKLIKGKNEVYDTSVPFDYMSGGFSDIKSDVIKYPREFLTRSKGYVYEVDHVIPGDRKVYKIAFQAKNKGEYEGFLYIEEDSFALLKAEISYSEYGLGILNKLTKGVGFEWDELQETIVYRKGKDNKYNLSEIISEGIGYDYHLADPLVITSEIMVIETDKATFFANEFSPIQDHLSISEMDFEATPFFWEDNNYMVLEDSFTDTRN